MRIDVVCDSCTDLNAAVIEPKYMDAGGVIFHHPESKSQAQEYTCPKCKRMITVIVYPGEPIPS